MENGANPDFRDHLKQTCLFYFAREGKFKCVELLVDKYKVDFEPFDINGQTPMFYAALKDRLSCIKKLIERGANVQHVDALMNQTALFYAARYLYIYKLQWREHWILSVFNREGLQRCTLGHLKEDSFLLCKEIQQKRNYGTTKSLYHSNKRSIKNHKP